MQPAGSTGGNAVSLGDRVQPQDADVALAGWKKPIDQAHGGGLASAIRTKQTQRLTPLDGEAQVIQRRVGPIAVGEVFNLDDSSIVYPWIVAR